MNRKMSLMEIVHDMAHRSKVMSIDEQAAMLGVSSNNFYNMLSPHAESFHYRLSMLLPHMKHLDSRAPLDYLASQMDCVVLPLPKTPEGMDDVQLELNRTIKELGDVLQEMGKAMSPDGVKGSRISVSEARKIEKEIYELVPQVMALLRSVQAEARG